MPVPFFSPDLSEAEIQAICEVLRTGWITTGPVAARLERALARFCRADYAVCLSSQTAAAELTLRLLGIGPGDEVLLPAYTYTATAGAVCHVGAAPVLIDCAPGQYTMDEGVLEAAITEKTKAIIPVDFAGIPCDAGRLVALAGANQACFAPASPLQEALGRIAVVSDASHSLGGSRNKVPCGGLADFSCFSFHAVKNLTTAEGGAVVWRALPGIDSGDLERQLRLLSLHGQSRSAFEKQRGAWEYDVLFPGYKCNMTDLSAALGLAQLTRYPQMLSRRRTLIEQFDAALCHLPLELPRHFATAFSSSGHLYPVRIKGYGEAERNRLIDSMYCAGVACNVHYKPLPMLTAYRSMGFSIEAFPNAYAMYQNEITLPLFSAMTDEQAAEVTQTLSKQLLK